MQTIVGLPLFVFKTIKSLPIISLRKKGGINYITTTKILQCAFFYVIVVFDKCSITSRQAKKEKIMHDTQKNREEIPCLPIIKTHTHAQTK